MKEITMDNDTLLQKASDLAENGKYDLARKFVVQAIKNNPLDVEAWWAMAHVARTDQERNRAISKVLELEPNHFHALHMRDQIRAGSLAPLGGAGGNGTPKSGEVDFMPKAAITLVAYFVMYFVGLGLNLYFLYDANQFQKKYGVKPDNVGCLWALFAVSVIFPVGVCMFVVMLSVFGAMMAV